MNPYYYGLVKQIGPWKTTRTDILRGQKPYQYTPNEQTELPYTMKAGNGNLYAAYSSQGLIYDASTSPVMVSFGKVRRGKIQKAKKVVVVDSDGKLVAPTDNYFLNRYMGEIRQEVQNDILESDLGGGRADMAMLASPRASTVSMPGGPANSVMSVDPSANGMDEGEQDAPLFENLGINEIVSEQMVDRGAQNGARVLNDQIDFIQGLENERILRQQNYNQGFDQTNILEFNRQDLERPEDIERWDAAFGAANNLGLPAYEREYRDPDIPMSYRERLDTRRRSSTASYIQGGPGQGIRYSQARPTTRQRS